jgi:hypothetical protein
MTGKKRKFNDRPKRKGAIKRTEYPEVYVKVNVRKSSSGKMSESACDCNPVHCPCWEGKCACDSEPSCSCWEGKCACHDD